MQYFLTSVKIIIFILVAGSALLYLAQDHLIFYPAPTPTQTITTYKRQQYTVKRDGLTLHGWFINGKDKISLKNPLLIYYGGNAEDVSTNLPEINNYPTSNLLFMNYRGYGQNQGKPSEENLSQDALYIFDQISKQHEINPQEIILLGRSLGTGVATFVASKRKVRAVILVTPFDSLLNIAKKQYPIFPVKLMLKHPFNSLALSPSIESPLLNLMAEHDTIIPKSHAEKLAAHWQGPVVSVTIKNAGHNDINSFKEYWQHMNHFIKNTY